MWYIFFYRSLCSFVRFKAQGYQNRLFSPVLDMRGGVVKMFCRLLHWCSHEVTWPHVSWLHDDVCLGQAFLVAEQHNKLRWVCRFQHTDVPEELIGFVTDVCTHFHCCPWRLNKVWRRVEHNFMLFNDIISPAPVVWCQRRFKCECKWILAMDSEGNSRTILKFCPTFRQERHSKTRKPGYEYHVFQHRIEMDVSCITLALDHLTTCCRLITVLRIVRSALIIEAWVCIVQGERVVPVQNVLHCAGRGKSYTWNTLGGYVPSGNRRK